MAHARHGLVEQHHLGVESEGGGDFQRALAPIGHLHRRDVGEFRQAHILQQRHGARVEGLKHALGAPEVEIVAALALQGHAHILHAREMGKDRRNLEGAHQSEPRHISRRHGRDVRPPVGDGAARGLQELGQQVEAGGFARPIGADERVDGAPAHAQVHIPHSREAREFLRQPLRFEDDVLRHASRPLRSARHALSGKLSIPAGNTSAMQSSGA